ncbi:MAG: AAA family ATPase [Acidobacteria bacterium]|nr:AAA family ATPase [Acidobacteriota bacterium]
MKLEVTDFGPVARAEVELRPLTVFVGPSNTGKTWLATLAYALHRYFGPRGWHPWFRVLFETPALPEGASTDLFRITEDLTAAATQHAAPAREAIALTPPIEAAIRRHLKEQGGELGKEIERCFGIDAGDHLIRKGGVGRARIVLRHAVEGVRDPAVHELTVADETWTFLSTIPDGLEIRRSHHHRLLADLSVLGRELKGEQTQRIWDAIDVLANDVLPNHHPVFYLPADRTGLMNAHSTVVSALIESATMAGIRRADPSPALSGVRGDFLKQLGEMASGQRRQVRRGREPLRRLGKRIEDEILHGAVKVGGLSGIAYPHFTYRPGGWKTDLPLTSASSMVSELAPVVLYLRHLVTPSDVLIIDEPESHLHPAMQVAFTRRIAEIVRTGVQVILTTHSEWVLEELGNVVGRFESTDRSNRPSDAESLDAGDVGVWLFEPANDGCSTVKEITLDADTGLYPSGFDAVATALHNEWAAIVDPRGDAE